MKKTKIDWCDCTINPVVGCQNGCKYCYGEKINCRFHIVKNWKQPEYFPERLKQFESKKPKSVFIDSMSDIGCWRQEWYDEVMNAIGNNAQHRYIALTKRPDGFLANNTSYAARRGRLIRNFFVGVSVTSKLSFAHYGSVLHYFDFLSIEPLLAPVGLIDWAINQRTSNIKLLIIGAETGTRADKVIPQKEWVDDIVSQADAAGVSVFMKDSLRAIMGDDFRQDKLLWEVD